MATLSDARTKDMMVRASMLVAAGLPDTNVPRRDVHRTGLEIIERYFSLSLPRRQVLEAALPAVVLEIA